MGPCCWVLLVGAVESLGFGVNGLCTEQLVLFLLPGPLKIG